MSRSPFVSSLYVYCAAKIYTARSLFIFLFIKLRWQSRAYGVTQYEVVTAKAYSSSLCVYFFIFFIISAFFFFSSTSSQRYSLFAKTFGLPYLRKSCALLCSWSSNKNKATSGTFSHKLTNTLTQIQIEERAHDHTTQHENASENETESGEWFSSMMTIIGVSFVCCDATTKGKRR